MKKISLLAFFFLSTSILLVGQPKNLEQAISQLEKNCDEELKLKITETPDEQIRNLFYPWDGKNKIVFEWFSNKKNPKISRYYSKLGITERLYIEHIVLISFKRHLLQEPINHDELLTKYRKKQIKLDQEDEQRFEIDSLNGIYIPKDLEDCFTQINSFWSDSTINTVKTWTEDEFTAKAHLGFGMWMRNNWQLWKGSRLSKYFNEQRINHPDDMSGIILTSYHRMLLGKDIELEEQLEYYKKYWEQNKE